MRLLKSQMDCKGQMITHVGMVGGRKIYNSNSLLVRTSWSVPLDIQSSNFKIPQQSKSSKIVSLFKVIIHKRCVLLEKKRQKKRLQKIQNSGRKEVKYIKKHNSIYKFVCDNAKITKQQISGHLPREIL